MMKNLFSTFDPSSSFFSSSWLAMLAVLMILPTHIWVVKSPILQMASSLPLFTSKEISQTMKASQKSHQTMISSVFMLIILMNFTALYPQLFSTTSHLTITLPLSLTFWTTTILFGWAKNTSHMLTHLVPQGTPNSLMSFMVIIELVSNIIRPLTLCVRLTANLIAGHLLMTLLGNSLMSIKMEVSFVLLPVTMLLTILESAVACIQAYVFMTLITLYATEVK